MARHLPGPAVIFLENNGASAIFTFRVVVSELMYASKRCVLVGVINEGRPLVIGTSRAFHFKVNRASLQAAELVVEKGV